MNLRTAPLREVMQAKKAAGVFRLALECAHIVVRRRQPKRARCPLCNEEPYHGPLFAQDVTGNRRYWPV